MLSRAAEGSSHKSAPGSMYGLAKWLCCLTVEFETAQSLSYISVDKNTINNIFCIFLHLLLLDGMWIKISVRCQELSS